MNEFIGKWRQFIVEGILKEEYAIGDEVILRGSETVTDVLKVVDMRRMFGSKLAAYTVEFPDGHDEFTIANCNDIRRKNNNCILNIVFDTDSIIKKSLQIAHSKHFK